MNTPSLPPNYRTIIRAWCRDRDVTRSELATLAGLNRPNLTNWPNWGGDVQLSTISKLIKAMRRYDKKVLKIV